jgi:hypothetical protein
MKRTGWRWANGEDAARKAVANRKPRLIAGRIQSTGRDGGQIPADSDAASRIAGRRDQNAIEDDVPDGDGGITRGPGPSCRQSRVSSTLRFATNQTPEAIMACDGGQSWRGGQTSGDSALSQTARPEDRKRDHQRHDDGHDHGEPPRGATGRQGGGFELRLGGRRAAPVADERLLGDFSSALATEHYF